MDSIKIIVPFPPSSNMAYPDIIIKVKGKPQIRRVKSERLKEWLASCGDFSGEKKFERCVVIYKMFFPDDRIRDGQSYLKPTLDFIVSQGLIEDDNRRIVKGEQWMDGGIDRDNPRIEITIKEI